MGPNKSQVTSTVLGWRDAMQGRRSRMRGIQEKGFHKHCGPWIVPLSEPHFLDQLKESIPTHRATL